jgi:hypothetical protein
VDHLKVLERKEEKWAFAYKHSRFVAVVASTQRQEIMMNYQVKKDLLANATLIQLLKCFEECEKEAKKKIIKGSLRSKMGQYCPDHGYRRATPTTDTIRRDPTEGRKHIVTLV